MISTKSPLSSPSAVFILIVCASTFAACAAPATTTTTLTITTPDGPTRNIALSTIITVVATVRAGGEAVTVGQVNLCSAIAPSCADIHLIGTAQLTSAGTATFKFAPGLGRHKYKAVFAGTTTEATSSSDVAILEVTGLHPTATTVSVDGKPGNYTLTATVAGMPGGRTSPSGIIAFHDVTAANKTLRTATLIPSNQTFSWINSQSPIILPEASGIVTADLNGDGMLDLALPSFTDNKVEIYLGHGNGTFSSKSVRPLTGLNPNQIVTSDFNGDGIPDLIISNQQDNSLTILLGIGDGSFAAPTTLAGVSGPLVVADFNHDGRQDLAVLHSIANSFLVLFGKGDGTFTAGPETSVGFYTTSFAVGDFNGDGIPDIVSANFDNNTITVMLGNGDGRFTLSSTTPNVDSPQGIVVADFNRDGIPDVAVCDLNGNAVTTLLGNGDGTFGELHRSYAYQPRLISVGDFNRDGTPDLITANSYGGNLVLYYGNGDGTFNQQPISPMAGQDPEGIAIGDFNGDGTPDIVIANALNNTLTVLLTQYARTSTATVTGVSPVGNLVHHIHAHYAGRIGYGPSISPSVSLVSRTGPEAILSATSADFGNQDINVMSDPQTFTVTNTGNAPLVINSIALMGANPDQYLASNNCGAGLAEGASCSLTVRFYPRSTGELPASLSLTDNGNDSPQSLALDGTGIVPATTVTLSSAALDFGDQKVGTLSPVHTVVLTNTGAATLAIDSTVINGPNAASFSTHTDCFMYLGAGSSCNIYFHFKPTATGPATAVFKMYDNAVGSPRSITLSGTGQ